jgi:hypothetical protein
VHNLNGRCRNAARTDAAIERSQGTHSSPRETNWERGCDKPETKKDDQDDNSKGCEREGLKLAPQEVRADEE